MPDGFELNAQLATRRRQNDLAFHVAARAPEVPHAVAALAQGDDGEHAPQTIPALQIVLALRMVAEETQVDRLQDVFGIDLGAKQPVEALAREGAQPAAETIEYFSRGRLIAGAQAGHHVVEGRILNHRPHPAPGTTPTPAASLSYALGPVASAAWYRFQ